MTLKDEQQASAAAVHRSLPTHRRLPVGAELLPDGGGTHFRVWAPKRRSVRVVFEDQSIEPVTLCNN